MEEHVQSLLPRERPMVLSSGVSVSLVDDTRRSTSAVTLAKAYLTPLKTEMAVIVKADREGLSLLKPLYVKGRLLFACNGVSCLPATGECFLITIANFGDTVACVQPGTTVSVATNIEQLLLLMMMSMRSATGEKKYLWVKYLSRYENKHWQYCLSMHLCGTADSARLILLVTVWRPLEGRSFNSLAELDPLPVPRNKPRSIECLRKTSSSLLRPNDRRLLSWYLNEMAECASVLTIVN
jgi:hypothetical protein